MADFVALAALTHLQWPSRERPVAARHFLLQLYLCQPLIAPRGECDRERNLCPPAAPQEPTPPTPPALTASWPRVAFAAGGAEVTVVAGRTQLGRRRSNSLENTVSATADHNEARFAKFDNESKILYMINLIIGKIMNLFSNVKHHEPKSVKLYIKIKNQSQNL
jgi:hypothetical protein